MSNSPRQAAEARKQYKKLTPAEKAAKRIEWLNTFPANVRTLKPPTTWPPPVPDVPIDYKTAYTYYVVCTRDHFSALCRKYRIPKRYRRVTRNIRARVLFASEVLFLQRIYYRDPAAYTDTPDPTIDYIHPTGSAPCRNCGCTGHRSPFATPELGASNNGKASRGYQGLIRQEGGTP